MVFRLLGGFGVAIAATLFFAPPPVTASAQGYVLEVTGMDGEVHFSAPVAEGTRWCVRWNHSVAGFTVSDCYLFDGANMVLEKSHQPDFAAGLGHIEGRGVQRAAAEGGYWIEGIGEIVPDNCYRLRVGAPRVNHRIGVGTEETSLSERAAGQPVRVAVRKAGDTESKSC